MEYSRFAYFKEKFEPCIPSCPHCIYNRFIINDLCSKDKKIALIHALILSQCFEVYFHINYLFSATYHFLIDRFDLI